MMKEVRTTHVFNEVDQSGNWLLAAALPRPSCCLTIFNSSTYINPYKRVSHLNARRRLRSSTTWTLVVPRTVRSTIGDRTFLATAASVWNSLPESVRSSPSLQVFRSRLKIELFAWSYSRDEQRFIALTTIMWLHCLGLLLRVLVVLRINATLKLIRSSSSSLSSNVWGSSENSVNISCITTMDMWLTNSHINIFVHVFFLFLNCPLRSVFLKKFYQRWWEKIFISRVKWLEIYEDKVPSKIKVVERLLVNAASHRDSNAQRAKNNNSIFWARHESFLEEPVGLWCL